MSDSTTSDESIGLRPASQIVARPVAWLWLGRLALGKLAMLDGDPGAGKSLVTLDLCARLSTGQPFPDGSLGPGLSFPHSYLFSLGAQFQSWFGVSYIHS